jgi:hypothetical protein
VTYVGITDCRTGEYKEERVYRQREKESKKCDCCEMPEMFFSPMEGPLLRLFTNHLYIFFRQGTWKSPSQPKHRAVTEAMANDSDGH